MWFNTIIVYHLAKRRRESAMKLRPLPKDIEAELVNNVDVGVNCALFTTLRYEPRLRELTRRIPIAMEDSDDDVLFLSRLHQKRLRYGAQVLGWQVDISHQRFVDTILAAVGGSHDKPQRVRVVLTKAGELTAEANVVAERDNLFSGLSDTPARADSADPTFDVVADSHVTDPTVFVRLKTTHRKAYDDARRRAGIELGQNREVLIIGPNGSVLEGSQTSVAVLRDGEWVTPGLGPGGAVGVLRSFLLELGFVKEGKVTLEELHDGDQVLLFNGVIGVCKGIFHH